MRNPDDPTASTDSPARDGDEQSFYGRWSRRKRQARVGLVPADEPEIAGSAVSEPDTGSVPAPVSEAHAAEDPEAGAEPVLTDADMPLDSLGEDDDYSGFMSSGVSEALRNRALRKLFMSGKYNVTDGLDDYADDFTSFEPLGDIITSDMRHALEMEAERVKREAEEKARALLNDDPEALEAGEDSDEAPADDPALAGDGREGGAGDGPEDTPGEDAEEARDV